MSKRKKKINKGINNNNRKQKQKWKRVQNFQHWPINTAVVKYAPQVQEVLVVDPLRPAIQTQYGKIYYIDNFMELGGDPSPDVFKKENPLDVVLEETYNLLIDAKLRGITIGNYETLLKTRLELVKNYV